MNKLYAIALAAVLIAGATYGLIQYGRVLERADHLEQVATLQSNLAALGLVIQEFEGKAADNTRKAIEAERGRIDAIKTNDHQSATIKNLERSLRTAREKSQKNRSTKDGVPDNRHYRIIITDSVNRVWNEGRICDGLPASGRGSVLQKRLSAITGDDINEVIKYAQREYCACGLKYNKLWRHAERLTKECNRQRD